MRNTFKFETIFKNRHGHPTKQSQKRNGTAERERYQAEPVKKQSAERERYQADPEKKRSAKRERYQEAGLAEQLRQVRL